MSISSQDGVFYSLRSFALHPQSLTDVELFQPRLYDPLNFAQRRKPRLHRAIENLDTSTTNLRSFESLGSITSDPIVPHYDSDSPHRVNLISFSAEDADDTEEGGVSARLSAEELVFIESLMQDPHVTSVSILQLPTLKHKLPATCHLLAAVEFLLDRVMEKEQVFLLGQTNLKMKHYDVGPEAAFLLYGALVQSFQKSKTCFGQGCPRSFRDNMKMRVKLNRLLEKFNSPSAARNEKEYAYELDSLEYGIFFPAQKYLMKPQDFFVIGMIAIFGSLVAMKFRDRVNCGILAGWIFVGLVRIVYLSRQ